MDFEAVAVEAGVPRYRRPVPTLHGSRVLVSTAHPVANPAQQRSGCSSSSPPPTSRIDRGRIGCAVKCLLSNSNWSCACQGCWTRWCRTTKGLAGAARTCGSRASLSSRTQSELRRSPPSICFCKGHVYAGVRRRCFFFFLRDVRAFAAVSVELMAAVLGCVVAMSKLEQALLTFLLAMQREASVNANYLLQLRSASIVSYR